METFKVKHRCSYPQCDNKRMRTPDNKPFKRFFKFPNNPDRKQEWISIVWPNGGCPEKLNVFLCEDHFDEKDFTSTLKRRLSNFAKPCPPLHNLGVLHHDHSYMSDGNTSNSNDNILRDSTNDVINSEIINVLSEFEPITEIIMDPLGNEITGSSNNLSADSMNDPLVYNEVTKVERTNKKPTFVFNARSGSFKRIITPNGIRKITNNHLFRSPLRIVDGITKKVIDQSFNENMEDTSILRCIICKKRCRGEKTRFKCNNCDNVAHRGCFSTRHRKGLIKIDETSFICCSQKGISSVNEIKYLKRIITEKDNTITNLQTTINILLNYNNLLSKLNNAPSCEIDKVPEVTLGTQFDLNNLPGIGTQDQK